MFLPIYASEVPAHWGYAFRPRHQAQEPACRAWAPDGSEVRTAPDGIKVIHEPGRRPPQFAHELYFETGRRRGPADTDARGRTGPRGPFGQ